GYDIVHGEAAKGPDAPMHNHDFDLRFLVVEGAVELVLANERRVFHPGEICVVPRNVLHNEVLATERLRYIGGQRPVRSATRDGAAFEAELQRDGYKVIKGDFQPGPGAEGH